MRPSSANYPTKLSRPQTANAGSGSSIAVPGPSLDELISPRRMSKSRPVSAGNALANHPDSPKRPASAVIIGGSSMVPRHPSESPSSPDVKKRPQSGIAMVINSPSRQNTLDHSNQDKDKPSRQNTSDHSQDHGNQFSQGPFNISRQSSFVTNVNGSSNGKSTGIRYFQFARKVRRLGVAKESLYHISFESLLSGNWHELDRVFQGDYYEMYPTSSSYFRLNNAKKGKIRDAVFDDLVSGIEKIRRDANKKRAALRDICLRNPYLPLVIKHYSKVTTFFLGVFNDCFHNEHSRDYWCLRISLVSFGFVPAFLGAMWIFAIVSACTTGFLLDVLTFRYVRRFSDDEISWIRKTISQHPDLDSSVIEGQVADSFQSLANEVTKKHPDVVVHVWRGIERFDRWNLLYESYYRYKDEVMFIIDPPSDTYGQVMHTI